MARRPWFRPGTVYCVRVRNCGRGRIKRGYVGKTRHPDYVRRVEQHLFGSHDEPPKWWAADAVDYYPVLYRARITTFGLWWREILFIRVLFPLHNYKHNQHNPRRVIPPPAQRRSYPAPDVITAVERWTHKPPRGPSTARRSARYAV